ncbi:unnamed protein product [Candidula unifasciata]|uniref:WH1 domain-containing protein n=1 Tax=Candidula unifasciata TaxID=100452 RepID=A0A8S3ZFU3_9EUPU|nr:unnamed protein product [Candidula unifasciata]
MSAFKLGTFKISQTENSSRVSPLLNDGGVFCFTDGFIQNQTEEKFSNQEQLAGENNSVESFHRADVPPITITQPAMTPEVDVVKTNGSSSAFSDTSSDVSDITTSLPSASSGSAYVVPVVEGISEQDINQVDLFYRSHKTDVRVCRSLANLYISISKIKVKPAETQITRGKSKSFKDKKSKTSEVKPPEHLKPSDFSKDEWEFSKTGIPVLVLDSGAHLREKRLKIVLAEKGTGFSMWQDEFNSFTEYSMPHTNFHTVTISTDSTRLVGFSFDEANAATEFAEAVKSLTSDENGDAVNSSSKKKKKKEKFKLKYRPPKKVDISQPVCFVHVTKLQRPDLIGGFFPPPPSGAQLSRLGIPRAMSDSSGISECSLPSEH